MIFAVASVLGVSGFLRGGEFLASTSSDRPVLMRTDVEVRYVGNSLAVIVCLRQPKARWWVLVSRGSVLCGDGR